MALLYSFCYKGENDKCAILVPKAQIRKKLHERVCYPPGTEVSNDLCANTKEAHNRQSVLKLFSLR